jgi:co-chaperonin GroES (HSP10)
MNIVKGKIVPLRDNVLVSDMSFDEQRTATGIIIRSDDGKSEGVKPRWGKVWAIGPEQQDIKLGEWILVEHGRWTRGIKVEDENGNEIVIRMVETKSIQQTKNQTMCTPEV